MPSQILRTSSSHEEGGERDWGISTVGFSGSQGRVERLHAVRVQLEAPDQSGQRALRPVPNSEHTLEVDLVLLALGFEGPVREGLITQLALALDRRGNVATNGYATSLGSRSWSGRSPRAARQLARSTSISGPAPP
jgi:glutamate synthase (NADPH/NADH) small chain